MPLKKMQTKKSALTTAMKSRIIDVKMLNFSMIITAISAGHAHLKNDNPHI